MKLLSFKYTTITNAVHTIHPPETFDGLIPEPDSGWLLQRSNWKRPDWKHHKPTWFVHGPDGKARQHMI